MKFGEEAFPAASMEGRAQVCASQITSDMVRTCVVDTSICGFLKLEAERDVEQCR